MLGFLILRIAAGHGTLSNSHTIHVFDKHQHVDDKMYAELYPVKNILNTVTKVVHLKDGRKAKCSIPLHPIANQTNLYESSVVFSQYSDEEANSLLFPLEDQCVQHRTTEFLYEYCFKKYARQFDDQRTVINMKKALKESFSLGYAQNYSFQYNETWGIRSPPFASYRLDSIMYSYYQEAEHLVIVDGCLAKIRSKQTYPPQVGGLVLSIVTADGSFEFNVLAMIHIQLFLLARCAEEIIISDDFQLTSAEIEYTTIQADTLYAYSNHIVGFYLKAHDHFFPQQTLGVVFNERIHFVVVEKIHDTSAIEVEGFTFYSARKSVQMPKPIKKLILFDTQSQFRITKRVVYISDHIMFFNPLDNIEPGDWIVLAENKKPFALTESYEIVSVKDRMAYLSKHLTRGLRYNDLAFIQKRNSTQLKLGITLFNTRLSENQLSQLEFAQIVLFKNAQNDFYVEIPYKTFSAFSFQLGLIKNVTKPELQFYIHHPTFRPVRISFLSVPAQKIYVRTLGKQGTYTQMENRFENATIFGHTYWVVLDTEADILYLGRNLTLELGNLILKHRLDRTSEMSSGNLKIQFLKRSNNVKLIDVLPLPLSNYSVSRHIDGGFYHPLNYSLGQRGYYKERHYNGSYCASTGGPRESEVELECHPYSLMQILEVSEPQTCKYKLKVGSYLLCDRREIQYKNFDPQHQNIMCVVQK